MWKNHPFRCCTVNIQDKTQILSISLSGSSACQLSGKCFCSLKKTRSVSSEILHRAEPFSSAVPFFGRPLPLPVLDLRSLVLTLPFGLFGSLPAKSPDSEKDSLVELRDEDLRRRRLALALRRASCSAFSWGVQLPFTSASLSASSSSL